MWTTFAYGPASSLYAASDSGTVSLISNGKPTALLRCSSPVNAIAVDGTHMLIGCTDGVLRWYSLPNLEATAVAELEDSIDEEAHLLFSAAFEAGIAALTYSPDFTRLLAATSGCQNAKSPLQ